MPPNSPEILGEWEWEWRKTRIWYLFLQKNMNFDEIRDWMKAQGFCATSDEYRSHIRSWGFSKRNPKQTLNYISNRVEKRKRQGKRSVVVVSGRRWSEQKIQKETCRNFTPFHERLRNGSPRTPPGPMVSVCSPTPFDLTPHVPVEWPPDLPWLRFIKRASQAPVDILGMMLHRLRTLKSESNTNEVAIFGGSFNSPQVARYLDMPVTSDMSNPIKMLGHLRCILPESIPGEHLMRCQESTKNANRSARELIMLALHQISNKSINGFRCEVRRDEFLLDLVTQSGLVGLKDPLLEEPTAASILEEIWCAALRRCRVRIVSWILDVSNHHNLSDKLVACPFWKGHSHKPLVVVVLNHYLATHCCAERIFDYHPEKVSSHDVEETIRTLLAHRASPDHYCCGVHGTPLEMAVREGFYDIVKLFIEYSIGIHGQEYLREMDFGNLLRLPRHDIPLSEQNGMLDYFQSIHARAFPCPRDLFDDLLCPKGLIRAAVKGCPALLNRLRAMGADFNCHNARGEFPLGAVIAHQSSGYTPQCDIQSHLFERCELLFTLGASVNYVPTRTSDQKACPSALHIASFVGHDTIVNLLLRNKAHHHAPAPLCIDGTWLYGLGTEASNLSPDQARSPLSWALSCAHQRCAALLLESGAPMEGHELLLLSELSLTEYQTSERIIKNLIAQGAKIDLKNSSGETALDIAIRKGNHEVANILIHVGANINPSISLDWLGYFKIITAEHDKNTIYDGNISLENWFRLYPCESFHSQNARLDACVKVFGALGPLKFVLDRYPHAYTSYVLKNILKRMKSRRAKFDMFDMPVLPILYDLLKRRRPELVDIAVECEALCESLHERPIWIWPDLVEIVDMLLSQQPNLSSGMRSNPWANPLFAVFEWRFGWRLPYHTNYSMTDSALNKFLHHGFRANTALGLVALGEGCSIEQLQQLMTLGFDPRRRYRWSHTALQLAVRSNKRDMVRYLLSCGVKVNGRPRWGYCPRNNFEMQWKLWMYRVWCGLDRTALQVAVENGNWELTELLVRHGADVNAPPARIGGATALQLAAIKGYTGLVGWLISCGAKVHAQGATIKGMTAMEGAAASGRLDVVKLLFEHGNFRSGDGRRQYVRAVGFARRNACHILRSYMEHQVGWSDADEDMLREEDSNGDISVEEPFFKEDYDSNKDNGDYCRGKQCAGETESVDEEMDEPACCRGEEHMDLSNSRDGESDAQDSGGNESSSPTKAVSISHEDEASEPCGEGSNEDIWGMGHWDTAEPSAHGETFDGFPEDQTAADEDWGFLADAGLGYEGPAVSGGVVLGEVAENEEFTGEPWPPVPVPGWTDDFNGQTDWIGYNGYLPGDLMDLSEDQVGETQAGNPFINMDMDQQE